MLSKCEMARLRYCRKTYFGYCNADDTDVERCPYLEAIEEITRLVVENSKLNDKLKWLWSWIEVGEQIMSEQEMLDYLISTGLYEITSKNSPYRSLYYEQRMIKTDKTVPIKELVKRFIEIDKEYNGEPWNIKQILANINIIIPVEDR